jgi:hypothetical protein
MLRNWNWMVIVWTCGHAMAQSHGVAMRSGLVLRGSILKGRT